jgi:hypothetical protein
VDQLPPGVTFVDSSQGAIYNIESNTLTWQIDMLPAGTSMPGWLTVKISDDLPNGTQLVNTFITSGEDAAANPVPEATATAETVVYTQPLLSIEKTGPAQSYPGQNLT